MARKASEHCAKLMIKRAFKQNLSQHYNVKDAVLVRMRDGAHLISKKYHVRRGIIVKKNQKLSKYKVSFRDPKTLRQTQKWFFVSDITSATRLRKKTHSKKPKTAPSKRGLNPLLFQYTHTDRLEEFMSMELSICYDPDPDGNCQFAAMADQLSTLGIFRSPESLSDEIVQDLRNYPYNGNGTLLFNFVEGNDWDGYLERMSQTGTYGDHITLQRASEIFQVQFLVISSLGINASTIVSESNIYCHNNPVLVLGHVAEGHGDHYLSLEGPVTPFIEHVLDAQAGQLYDNNTLSPLQPASPDESDAPIQPDEPEDPVLTTPPVQPVLPTEMFQSIIKMTLEDDMEIEILLFV